ncbi:MAG: DUF1062 domain-containing protein [Pseudomonadota bacterium]
MLSAILLNNISIHSEIIEWRLVPTSVPKVKWLCGGCKSASLFESTGKFRVNAQKKTIDVWLIYSCTNCGHTWNASIYKRVSAKNLSAEEFLSFQRNDEPLALKYAFDFEMLKRNSAIIDQDIEFEVLGKDLNLKNLACNSEISIVIKGAYPVDLRLDKILSQKLGVSRNELKKLIDSGKIQIAPKKKGLKRSLKEDLFITIKLNN